MYTGSAAVTQSHDLEGCLASCKGSDINGTVCKSCSIGILQHGWRLNQYVMDCVALY